MESTRPKALLIQEKSQGSWNLERYVQECGCDCSSAASYREACSLLDAEKFDLVLSPMRLPDSSLFPLLSSLSGSRTTLFYWFAVDGGCFWLPALRNGLNCVGSATLNTRQFVIALDEIIKEVRLRQSPISHTQETAAPQPDSPVAVR
jgi:hypothetical protein